MAGEWGHWQPIIGFLTPLLIVVATLMMVVGGLMIMSAAGNDRQHDLGWTIVKCAMGGFVIGALAEPLYMTFVAA